MTRPNPILQCDECGDDLEQDQSGLCKYCLEQITCPDCGAVEGTEEWGTVGDGFDGYCPSCADKREEAGVYD